MAASVLSRQGDPLIGFNVDKNLPGVMYFPFWNYKYLAFGIFMYEMVLMQYPRKCVTFVGTLLKMVTQPFPKLEFFNINFFLAIFVVNTFIDLSLAG